MTDQAAPAPQAQAAEPSDMELKAQAYDLIEGIEIAQMKLRQTNEELARRRVSAVSVPAEAAAEPTTNGQPPAE